MTYVVVNQTNSGVGVYMVGTFRSKKSALAVIKALENSPRYNQNVDSFMLLGSKALDSFTPDSVADWFWRQG